MNEVNRFKLFGTLALLALGLAACDKTPGPAESAGKKIDQTVLDAGKKIDQAVLDTGKKMGETADKVGEKISVESGKAEVVIDDAEITAKVKAAIFAEPGLKTLQISVDTVKGVVTLSGSIDSTTDSDKTKALAGAVSGVKAVDNQLKIKVSS